MEVEYEQPPEHAEQRHEEESHHSDGEGAEGVEPAAGGEGEGTSSRIGIHPPSLLECSLRCLHSS